MTMQSLFNHLGTFVVCSALNLQLYTAVAQVITFTNPSPQVSGFFGYSVAAVGNERVLIGAPTSTNAGAAYLFSTNGGLIKSFTNPTPGVSANFGYCVAGMGSDRALIGAPAVGAAYLFSTNGALLATFNDPTPTGSNFFGNSIAAVGTNWVLIGDHANDTGATNAGAAYLFSTGGALLTTFNNPTPALGDWFGWSVAAVGTNCVLIGALNDNTGATGAGAAYLFSTGGALITTFTNPTPLPIGLLKNGDQFGYSVAAVGSDRVLIGAVLDDTVGSDAGAAYLFKTNGVLLTTFTNSTSTDFVDAFGSSVAALGTERVLIGAYSVSMGAFDSGAAYLFSTNGALLTTLTNPSPAFQDCFGFSVAAVGTDRVLIGAFEDDTGANNAGAAYLFTITQTSKATNLTIRLTSTNTVAISWPSPSTGWTLQQNTNGVASVNWSNAPGTIQDDGTNRTLIFNPPTGNRFYRLFKP